MLAHTHFDVDAFIHDEMQVLTPATGVVVELVDGSDMVYRAVTGSVAGYLNLRLPFGAYWWG